MARDLGYSSDVAMQVVGSLASAGLAVSTAADDTLLAGSGQPEVAHGNPAVWQSECVQNCHFRVRDHKKMAGEGP